MSDQGTQTEPTGTTVQGQPESAPAGQAVQTGGGVPHDPKAMQADYSRKTAELANERKRLEAERAELARMRQQFQTQQPQYNQSQQPTFNHAGQNMTQNQLIEQFGPEGAQVIMAAQQAPVQQLQHSLASMAYHIADKEGAQKYGEESWRAHEYYNAQGFKQNKVLELMGKGLSLEEAWRASNPVDESAIKQRAIDEYVQQRKTTAENQPVSQSNANPSSSGGGHARSIAEAVNQAIQQFGGTK